MPGLDPGIHPPSIKELFSEKKMDCRVKPGNDELKDHRAIAGSPPAL
jgi:hypothetical protein